VGFFKRARGQGDQAERGADWAQPMSASETAEFLEAVGAHLERRGLRHELGDGIARVEYAGETQELGLSNLAQLCRIADRAERARPRLRTPVRTVSSEHRIALANVRDDAVDTTSPSAALAPLVDLGVVESINRLIPSALSLFNEGPGSISPGIYWWRDGSVTLLPSEVSGRNVRFAPPDELVEVLDALPPASA